MSRERLIVTDCARGDGRAKMRGGGGVAGYRRSPLRLIVMGKRLPLNLMEYEEMSVVLVLPLP